MKRRNGVRAAYVAFLLHALQAGFGCSLHWKKPIHGIQLFFAAAVWLVLPKCAKTLR